MVNEKSLFRLSYITWLVLLLVGGALLAKNLIPDVERTRFLGTSGNEDYPRTANTFESREFGFPFAARTQGSSPSENGVVYLKVVTLSYFALSLNIILALLILACTTFTLEVWLRRKASPNQFSIKFLLAFVAAIALLLGLIQQGVVTWQHTLYVPIAFGLLCSTVCVVVIMARLISILRHRFNPRLSKSQ